MALLALLGLLAVGEECSTPSILCKEELGKMKY